MDGSGERRAAQVVLGDPPARVEFQASGWGEAVEITCRVTYLGVKPVYLAVTTSRTARRLADLELVASVGDLTLPDPAANLPYLGGPATTKLLAEGESRVETVSLQQYVDLRGAPEGLMTLRCRRRIQLSRSSRTVFRSEPVLAEVVLLIDLAPDPPMPSPETRAGPEGQGDL